MVIETKKVINGKVQKVYTLNFPIGTSAENKQYWMLNRGYTERTAYMLAFNISEAEMQRIEND